MLITFAPEDSKDFNIQGGSGLPKLPIGTYDIDMAIVNIEPVQHENSPMKLAVTYTVINPKATNLTAGQLFGDYINIQNQNATAARIARQTVAKLGYAITGDENIMAKGQLNFDYTLYNRPFNAIVASTESSGGVDSEGKPKTYKNINIGKVTPLPNGNNQLQQQSYNNAQPQVTPTAPWGAPQR